MPQRCRDLGLLPQCLPVLEIPDCASALLMLAGTSLTMTVGSVVTAAQVAMLGGQWRPAEDAEESEALNTAGTGQQPKRKGPSRAMPVSDFLAKGEGGSLLPRNKQDRKDKEKEKRSKGQSSVHGWKSEAEMVLRQQYD